MSGITFGYLNISLLLITDQKLNIDFDLNIDSTGSLSQIHPSRLSIQIITTIEVNQMEPINFSTKSFLSSRAENEAFYFEAPFYLFYCWNQNT